MLDRIIDFFYKKREEVNKKYDRVLPFGENINDRWEKAKNLNFSENKSVYDSSLVLGDIRVGKEC